MDITAAATLPGRAAPEPSLEHVYSARVNLGAPVDLGASPRGYRLIVPILGGKIDGPGVSGLVCPSGADWILVRPDDVSELDVRAAVATDDGALIYVTIRGYITNQTELVERVARGEAVPIDDYYFGLTPSYETSDARYAWMMSTVFVGRGTFHGDHVIYDAYAVR
jgi:hypothetical protein